MKRILLCAALLCLAVPGFAADDPFAGFRIPAHRTRDASLGLSVTGARSHYDARRVAQRTGSGTLAYDQGWDSERLRASAGLTLSGSVDWNRSLESRTEVRNEDERQSEYETARLSAELLVYPRDTPFGFRLSGWLYGQTGDSWTSYGRYRRYDWMPVVETFSDDHYTSRRYLSQASIEVGAGLGRVRDASVVYEVHVIERRLREGGGLVRDLSPAARERLAELLFLRPGFASAHELPARFVAAELERILREDGAIAEDGLDAASTVRMLESLQPFSYVLRQRGWFAGPVVSAYHAHDVQRSGYGGIDRIVDDGALVSYDAYTSRARDVADDDEVWGGFAAEVHRPLGWSWQLDAGGSIRHPLWPGERGFGVQSSVSLRWLLADRWDAGASLAQSRTYRGPEDDGDPMDTDTWQTVASADVGFWVEDHLRLSLSTYEYQYRDEVGGLARTQRSGSFRLGLTYRFLGALDAAALAGPVRPLD